MPKDSVLIVCGGLLQLPAVEAAHRLGLRAIVTDANPDAPTMRIADEAHVVDIYDIPNHVALGLKLRDRLAGVFTEGADVEVTVASTAAALGLPGVSVEAAKNCKNKWRMRQRLNAIGISPVRMGREAESSFPFVVKPSDNCGSRGIHIVNNATELNIAIDDAMKNSTNKLVLFEEYLTGPQQSVEILFDAQGKCHWLNIVDRIFDGVMEMGHVNPSRLPDEHRAALYQMTEQAAAAVGVNFGAFKGDTIWTDNGPRILEVTARLSGGFDCQRTTPLATGRDFIGAAMAVSCGLPIPEDALTPKCQRWAAAWAAFPKPGKVTRLPDYVVESGGGPWWGSDGMTRIFRVKIGDIIEPYEHCAQRPGFVIAIGDSYEAAIDNAKRGAAVLAESIVTE